MNIYDVSERAGVSIATVSRVLNGNPNVSERTRKKVLAVMDELGYTPMFLPGDWDLIPCRPSVSCVLTLLILILLRRSTIWSGNCAVIIMILSSAVPVTTWM
mgnify:FL=1